MLYENLRTAGGCNSCSPSFFVNISVTLELEFSSALRRISRAIKDGWNDLEIFLNCPTPVKWSYRMWRWGRWTPPALSLWWKCDKLGDHWNKGLNHHWEQIRRCCVCFSGCWSHGVSPGLLHGWSHRCWQHHCPVKFELLHASLFKLHKSGRCPRVNVWGIMTI